MKCLQFVSLPSSGTRQYGVMSSERNEMLVICITAKHRMIINLHCSCNYVVALCNKQGLAAGTCLPHCYDTCSSVHESRV